MNNLYELQRSDISKASAVMKSAFQDDPIFNVFAKQDSKNEKWLYALYEFPIRYSLRYGEVHAISENLEGIIAWLPDNPADFTIWRLMGSGDRNMVSSL